MNTQASLAIEAAKNRDNWGRYATRQFIVNRGVPLRLYYLALQLEATN